MNKIPTREQAINYLQEAYDANPRHYPWHYHCVNVAMLSQKLAELANLDVERAFISGLLHDIGRRFSYSNHTFEGERRAHEILGHEFLDEQGYPLIGRICLTHSFQNSNIEDGITKEVFFNNSQDLAKVQKFMQANGLDDYDRLIQLCDILARFDGFKTIEASLQGVKDMYGCSQGFELKEENLYKLKQYFDELCGRDVYEVAREVTRSDWSNFDMNSLQ
jgi:putative nucleotidyltransferase with HDIG domain